MKLTPKQFDALHLVSEGRFYPTLVEEEDGWYARWRAVPSSASAGSASLDGWVDALVREATVTRLTEDAEDQRHETLHDAWMMALRSRTGLVVWEASECRAFAEELREWSGAAAEDCEARARLVFTFSATAANGGFSVSCTPRRTQRDLKALGLATYVWGPLRGLKNDGECLSVALSLAEAEDFVQTGAAALRDAGYTVAGLPARAEITATAAAGDAEASAPVLPASFRLTVRVAGQPVTADEIRFLLDQHSTLVWFRDHWIEVDRNILKEALRALEKGVPRKSNLLSFMMGVGRIGELEVGELEAHGWLRGLVNELRAAGRMPSREALEMPGFTGILRDYQRLGVAWLRFLTTHGFGALLADDMGLGKTVQVIAWMLADRAITATPSTPVLVVAPLTLLANWRHELARFAPALSVYVHQGDARHLASGFRRAVSGADVVITSYGLLVREHALFSECAWSALVLDEAQAIKNPETQVARAVKALSPAKRIALTGTPVENSLQDLWSLEDFLNPGFLGDRASFRDRFVRPLALDANAAVAHRLRHALEPFILRRLKTDPSIVAEIGEKREVREFVTLTESARRAYEEALAGFRATAHSPGDALALLTELKLICDGEGKISRLCDLLETIFENGESALVFTQYAKVGARLQTDLATRFGRRFPFLHGELSPAAREETIRRFSRMSSGAFILSLKTGGFGLNLTKATHVIHFDRWWNPAVENQATDRAYRIGQTRDVLVHLMITEGTVEEHVDALLAKKSSLRALIADGEAFWKAVRLT